MAGELSGKQLRAASIANTKLATGILSADSTGRALMATGFFTETKVDDAFVAGAIDGDRLKDGALSADATGRAKMAASYFDEATVDAKFAAGAIDTDRLKQGATFIKSDGTVAMAASLNMASQKIVALGAGTNATDAVNKNQLDSAVSGLQWREPIAVPGLLGNVDVNGLVGNEGAATIEGLTPAEGDAYVVDDVSGGEAPAGALIGAAVGDIWQYVSATWVKVVTQVGGFVPNGTYVLLNDTTALIAPYTDGSDEGKRVDFDGTTNDGSGLMFTGSAGDAYVVDGSGASGEGDLIEWSGTAWVQVVAASGGFVPIGTRAALGLTSAATLIAPYTNATDDTKIVEFSGANNTGADTSETTDGSAVLVNGDGGYHEDSGYVYNGTVPSGSWTQFTGAGQINAGDGIAKSGNTLSAKVSDFAGAGLEDDGSNNLRVKPDSVATADSACLTAGANGLSVDGDILNVDSTPINYTPTIAAGGGQVNNAADVDDLAAHLIGIDNAIGAIVGGALNSSDKKLTPAATAGDDSDTGIDITATPDGWVGVFVNGVGPYELGDGVTTKDAYFSTDGTPGNVVSIANIASGHSLVWNGAIAGFELDGNDRIDLVYET